MQHPTQEDIYNPRFVRGLFDEMAATYGLVNLVASFGFCVRWRRQCLAQVPIFPGASVYDLMSGMGELWPGIAAKLGSKGRISAVDFSAAMCSRARQTAARLAGISLEQRQEDILENRIPDESADVIVSSFGLKTFTAAQRKILAHEVARILRPGGVFSFLEISVPASTLLRWPYMIYLKCIIPGIGRLLLGNPENYRLLGVYTQAYGDCRAFCQACQAEGLEASFRRFFFGCATGVVGKKP